MPLRLKRLPILRRRPRQVVLYRAHYATPAIRREIARLRNELGPAYDIAVIGYCADPAALSDITEAPTHAYTRADLEYLPNGEQIDDPYWRFTGGLDDLPVHRFFRDHPRYDYYWTIEYDVRYTGNWAELFRELGTSRADLLATTIQRHDENPGWYHWYRVTRAGAPLPASDLVKAFVPFCRLSRAALTAIGQALQAGLIGNYEATWATATAQAGLIIEDIGGRGSFTVRKRAGRFYVNTPLDDHLSPGTFVFRPVRREDEIDPAFGPALWHPVKS